MRQLMIGIIRIDRWKGRVKCVVVVIKDRLDVALERFVFSVQTVLDVAPQHRDTP